LVTEDNFFVALNGARGSSWQIRYAAGVRRLRGATGQQRSTFLKMWSADRVLRYICAASKIPGDFSRRFCERLTKLAADYVECDAWLDVYFQKCPSERETYKVFRTYWFQQRMLKKEMDELCIRSLKWIGTGTEFNLFPEAEDLDTQYVLAIVDDRCFANRR
jgi:hypothetical protein